MLAVAATLNLVAQKKTKKTKKTNKAAQKPRHTVSHADRMRVGAHDPMLNPIHVFRDGRCLGRRRTSSGSGLGSFRGLASTQRLCRCVDVRAVHDPLSVYPGEMGDGRRGR